MSPNPIIAEIIGLGAIIWPIAIIAQVIILFSRYAPAQAFDRFLPERLAYVNKRGSPSYALLFVLMGSLLLVGSTAYFHGLLSALSSAIAAPFVYFFVVALSVLAYGMRKPKGGLRNGLIIFGLLIAIVMLYVLYTFVANPNIYGGNLLSYGYIVVSLITGVIVCFATKSYYSKRGIDVNLAYKQIPTE